ncbi:MAG: hypothetical protein ACREAC_23260, partial [Blastocatellia bacterium]
MRLAELNVAQRGSAPGMIVALARCMENNDSDLTELERKVIDIQQDLLRDKRPLDKLVTDDIIVQYARQLARHYLPKRFESERYIEPVIHAFCCDLVIAPLLHLKNYLWRYNYDDLDIVSNFYYFSEDTHGYYHLAHGRTDPPSLEALIEGFRLFELKLSETHAERLFQTYSVDGARARVAARVVETVAGRALDEVLNQHYGFLEHGSQQRLRRRNGLGRFRFLRRGRDWMALGTHPAPGTTDIRTQPPADLFGYRIRVTEEGIKVGLADRLFEQAKADLLDILEGEASVFWRVKRASDYYKYFYEQYRFANDPAPWRLLDKWLLVRVTKLLRAIPKDTGEGPPAARLLDLNSFRKKRSIPHRPRRTNFFWKVEEELNCPYLLIWNPYRWPEPDKRHNNRPGT